MDPTTVEQAIALAALKVNKDGFEGIAAQTARLADALSGARSIEGRPGLAGQRGPIGPQGRPGESIIEFRPGYDRRSEATADGLYVGHALHGTPFASNGWYIERITWAEGIAVELPEDVLQGKLSWADRARLVFHRSELATVRQRDTIKTLAREHPAQYLAAWVDGMPGFAGDRLDLMRLALCGRLDLIDAAVDTGSFMVEWPGHGKLTADELAWIDGLWAERTAA